MLFGKVETRLVYSVNILNKDGTEETIQKLIPKDAEMYSIVKKTTKEGKTIYDMLDEENLFTLTDKAGKKTNVLQCTRKDNSVFYVPVDVVNGYVIPYATKDGSPRVDCVPKSKVRAMNIVVDNDDKILAVLQQN